MKALLITSVLMVLCQSNAQGQIGVASWYGAENSVSCTGKRLHHNRPALAHKTLKIGSYVKITDLKTKKSVIAVVEDRGPYIKGRIADVNKAAAKKLGILEKGITKVSIVKIK